MSVYGFNKKQKSYLLFTSVEDIPDCTSSTYLRTAADKMPSCSTLIMYVDDTKYPGSGTGILRVIKVDASHAIFIFSDTTSASNDTYISNFTAVSGEWVKTAVVWTKLSADADTSDLSSEFSEFKEEIEKRIKTLETKISALG